MLQLQLPIFSRTRQYSDISGHLGTNKPSVFDFEASKSNQEQVLVRPSKYPTRSPSGVKAFSTKTSQLTSLNK